MRGVPIGIFAMALAAAGLPLYIHLPRFAEVSLGLSLSTVGAILIGIRVLDFIQDPALGWMVDRYPKARKAFVAIAATGLALGFLGLFTLEPLFSTVHWLIIVLALIFTAFSLATILFYGQTRALSSGDTASAMIDIAKWREGGSLIGIILAAALPTWLGYPEYGIALAVLVVIAAFASRGIWTATAPSESSLSFDDLRRSGGFALLGLSLVNTLPLAMTSTLFVFFVEDRLGLPDASGGLLILFFLAAAISMPLWAQLAKRLGPRPVLVIAMSLAIVSFSWAATLGGGEALTFGIICVASGFAAGADMLILPALFSSALARAELQTGQAFGIWSFVNKMSLAGAAALCLPLLDAAGFQSATQNSPEALSRLTLLYAVIPSALKLLAIFLLLFLPKRAFAT